MRSQYGWKGKSGPGKALAYVAALAVLFVVAVIIPVLLIAHVAKGEGGLAMAVLVLMYLGLAPALLIPYTWRFWFVPHQVPLAETLLRASICGVLFPIIVSLFTLLILVSAAEGGCDGLGARWYMAVWIISFILCFPLTAIGVVRAPLKQP